MNSVQMQAWLDAMLAEHAAGRLPSALLEGAFDLSEEVRRQWSNVARERARDRYQQPNPPVAAPRLPTKWDRSQLLKWEVSGVLAMTNDTVRRIANRRWSRCVNCHDFRVHGQLGMDWLDKVTREVTKTEFRDAYLYFALGDPGRWRASAGKCSCAISENIARCHEWEAINEPPWMAEKQEQEQEPS